MEKLKRFLAKEKGGTAPEPIKQNAAVPVVFAPTEAPEKSKAEEGLRGIFTDLESARSDAAGRDRHFRKEHKDF
jgi:hypothetical protein